MLKEVKAVASIIISFVNLNHPSKLGLRFDDDDDETHCCNVQINIDELKAYTKKGSFE